MKLNEKRHSFLCLVELLCITAEKAGLPDCLVGLFVKAIR